MNLNKLVVGLAALVIAIASGFAFGTIGWVFLSLLLLALLSMFVDQFVYIRVGEMETAVVYNREARAFSRFLGSGRHALRFPLERVTATVSTAPAVATGRCNNVQTQEGVGVDLNYSVTFQVFPSEAKDFLQPNLARFLPSGGKGFVRNHASNCVTHVVNLRTVEAWFQNGARSHLERELRDAIQERLHPFGVRIYRVMVTEVILPLPVQKALEEAHDRRVYAESEACALEKLHTALQRFSKSDVEKLVKIRQLRELGQNGVALQMPYFTNVAFGGNGDDWQGNGRSPDDSTILTPDSGGRPNGRPLG